MSVEAKTAPPTHRVFVIGSGLLYPYRSLEGKFVTTPDQFADIVYNHEDSLIGVLPECRRDKARPYGGKMLGTFFPMENAQEMKETFEGMITYEDKKWFPARRGTRWSPEESLAVLLSLRALESAGIRRDDFDPSIPWKPIGENDKLPPLRIGIGVTNSVQPTDVLTRFILTEHDPSAKLKDLRRARMSMAFGGFIGNINGAVRDALHAQGPAYNNTSACATALFNIHDAFRDLHHGDADLAIVGGFELFSSISLAYFLNEVGAAVDYEQFADKPEEASRPGDRNPAGLTNTEGGNAFILATETTISRLHIPQEQILMEIVGSATGQDWGDIRLPNPPIELIRVMEAAITDADITPQDIGLILPHGTGTKSGEIHEWQAHRNIWNLPHRGFDEPMEDLISGLPYTTLIKATTGHNLAGSGGASLLANIEIFRRDEISATRNIGPDGPHGMAFNLVYKHPQATNTKHAITTAIGVEGSVASVVTRST